MAQKLTKLTVEQKARIPEFRDRYLAMGLSTQPADRARAQNGVIAAYRAVNLEPPKIFIWLNSPMAGAYGAALLASKNLVRGQVGDQVWDQVGDQVWDQVRGQVGDQVWDQVGDQVWDQVGDQVYRAGYGQHDAGWLAFYEFFKFAGIADASKLDGLYELCAAAGWWWPFNGAVIITERPIALSRDARGRLHSENDAAIKYPDGWGIHAVHGVRMPGELVEDHSKITVARIDAEANAEVRRVLIGWYGTDRYMRDSGAKVVHQDIDKLGNPRRLLARTLPGDEPIVMVEVTDSTLQADGIAKKYMLRVDPKAYGGKASKECHAAIASTWRHKTDTAKFFFATPQSYAPTVET